MPKIKNWEKVGEGKWISEKGTSITLNPWGSQGNVYYDVFWSKKNRYKNDAMKRLNKINMRKGRAKEFAVNWMKKHPNK